MDYYDYLLESMDYDDYDSYDYDDLDPVEEAFVEGYMSAMENISEERKAELNKKYGGKYGRNKHVFDVLNPRVNNINEAINAKRKGMYYELQHNISKRMRGDKDRLNELTEDEYEKSKYKNKKTNDRDEKSRRNIRRKYMDRYAKDISTNSVKRNYLSNGNV